MKTPDGMIELDSIDGKLLGFTSDKFEGYLWRAGDAIYISSIVSKSKGNFRQLVTRILETGCSVKVPTPFPRMEEICRRNGYQHSIETNEFGDSVDIWTLPSAKAA